ncbi:MAG: hypothetical protein R3224_05625, partial [Balneolaceae bacterium]|nr:hypothetical protein [Balneolaceae bacterium]
MIRKLSAAVIALLMLGSGLAPHTALAQTQEPDVIPLPQPKTPFGQDKHNAIGFELYVNNFGFGIGGH